MLAPEELRSELVLASLEAAIVRPRAIVLPMGALRTALPVVVDTGRTVSGATTTALGGATFTWAAPGSSLTASAASYGRLVLEANSLKSYTGGVPNELVNDSPALDVYFRNTVPMAYAFAEDHAAIAGSGVGQPQGVLNSSAAVNVTRQTSSKVTFTDIISMVTRMLPQSMARFVWLCSPDVLAQLLQVYLAVGSPTTQALPPPGWLTGGGPSGWQLLGRPLYSTMCLPSARSAIWSRPTSVSTCWATGNCCNSILHRTARDSFSMKQNSGSARGSTAASGCIQP